MGVLTDYFRAGDVAAVVAAMESAEGGPLVGGRSGFDGVDAKGVDPHIVLGQLIAGIKAVPWSLELNLVTETMVWPTTPQPGPEGPADDDDPWATGPWVSQLDSSARDALAEADDAGLSEVVADWVEGEELMGATVEGMRPLAEALIELARRARDADEQLYCWICL